MMASNCSLSGIYGSIQSQLISVQSNLYQYGVFIGLGSPSQNSSLWPSIIHNETSFRTADFCVASTSIECFSTSDGNVSSVPSSTWQSSSSYRSLDDSSLYTNVSRQYGTDTLNIWADDSGAAATLLHNFPITLVPNYTSTSDHFLGPGDTLGLGSASTVLEKLHSQNLISSRSYGLYVGTTTSGVSGLENGSVILGGYDAARFSGPVHTYDQVPAQAANGFSSFKLAVASVSLEIGSGQFVELTEQVGFDAYLTTAEYPVRFPRSVTQKIVDSASATRAGNDDNTLRMPNGFTGSLAVTMQDGFKVTFNSSWLYDSLGISPISAAPLDNSTSFNADNDASIGNETLASFGIAFLQQVYLFVSYDNSPPTFSLAQANATSPFFQQEPYCPGVIPQMISPPKVSQFVQRGLIGAVLGGTIGGIALIFTAFIAIRYRLRKQALKEMSTEMTKPDLPPTPSRLHNMCHTLGRLRGQSDFKSVRFASNHFSISSSTLPSHNKSVSPDSRSSSMTKVSTTPNVTLTDLKTPLASVTNGGGGSGSEEQKHDLPPTPGTTRSSGLLRIPLNFGFMSPRTPRFPRDSHNPYAQQQQQRQQQQQQRRSGAADKSRWRTSSVYSSEV